jgi:3-methyladenine DNA glycosylase/8-oxoguanine DNA glycosylase
VEFLKLPAEELRLCQISRQKFLYLKELSSAVLDKKIDLMGLKDLSLPDVRKQLRSLAAYFLWHYYLNKRGRMNYLGGLGGLGGEGSWMLTLTEGGRGAEGACI